MNLSRSGFLTALGLLGAAGAAMPASAALPPWFPLPPPLRPKTPRRALVLSGAGARGAYQAGVLKWLYKDVDASGSPYDLVVGTSAGAINAAFAARASSAAIADVGQLWLGMPNENILVLVPPVQHAVNAAQAFQQSSEHGFPRRLSYLNRANREIRAMGPKEDLVKVMGVINDDGIESLVKKYPMDLADIKTSLIVTATNMTRFSSDAFYYFTGPQASASRELFLRRFNFTSASGEHTISPSGQRFALTDANLVKAVLASTAVPGVFTPVEVPILEIGTSDTYVDGGVANNTPISTAVSIGATDVTVVIASSHNEGMSKPPETLPALLQASFAVIQRELLEDDIRLSVARNLLGRYRKTGGLNPETIALLESIQAREWEPITMRVIRPPQPLKLTTMGFNDGPDLQAAFDEGYSDAQHPIVFSI